MKHQTNNAATGEGEASRVFRVESKGSEVTFNRLIDAMTYERGLREKDGIVRPIEKITSEKIMPTIWNSDGSDGPCLICAPSFEDIQAMAGFPVDSEGRALVVDEEENDDTRTIGLPSNEEAEADDSEADEIEERETPYRLRDEGRSYSGEGESYAERNA